MSPAPPVLPGISVAGMPMPGRRRGCDRNERLIPMINVVFLLLLFFIIAGTFRAADALRVEPPGAAAAGAYDPAGFTLVVTASGEMAIGADRMDRAQAVSRIGEWLAANPADGVQIKADRAAPASVIVPLLAGMAGAGVTGVRLIAVRTEKPR